MFEAARFELRYNFGGFARHLLDDSTLDRRKIKRTATQHNDWFLAVKPFVEGQHDFEGFTPDNNYVDAVIEFVETVRLLLPCIQEIERMVRPSKKAIDAHSAED